MITSVLFLETSDLKSRFKNLGFLRRMIVLSNILAEGPGMCLSGGVPASHGQTLDSVLGTQVGPKLNQKPVEQINF